MNFINELLLSILGDLGQTYNSLATLEHYMQSGAQAVLFVGDLAYADRYMYNDVGIRWDTWGRFVERSAAFQPWMWSVGNHEIEYMPYLVKCSVIHHGALLSVQMSPSSFLVNFLVLRELLDYLEILLCAVHCTGKIWMQIQYASGSFIFLPFSLLL